MSFRIGARTVAAAGAVTVVGVLAAPALGATTVSQATAQSLKLSIAGTPAVTQVVTATNDGTTQTKNNASTLPTLAQVLPGNNALGAGVAPQEAGANANGTSYACAGIAGTGGGIVHTGNTSCALNGAPLTLNLGNLSLGALTLDTTSAVGSALTSLGLNQILSQVVNGAVGNIASSVTNALKGTPLDISLGGTLSAIEGVCQATPTSATGATHLVDTQGGSNPTPIKATIGGQTITVAQLPANPPINTHVLVNLNTVTQTVIDAVKVELNNAVGGALQPLGLGSVLQQVQDAIVNQLVAQLQPLLQPLQQNVLDITLNQQTKGDAGRSIKVTALDLQVLPAASQFTGGNSLIGGQLGLVSCGPNTKAAAIGTPTTITSPPDGSTVGPEPVITGTAAPGSTVTVVDINGGTVCTAKTDPTGHWHCTPTNPLPVGQNTLTATASGPGADPNPSNVVHITVVAGGPGTSSGLPHGVDAGLAGSSHDDIALSAALSGTALAAAAGLALFYRRFASR